MNAPEMLADATFGEAVVEMAVSGCVLRVLVGVTFNRPDSSDRSFLRCSDIDAPVHCRAGALSGARYARHAVDPERFGIDVRKISGTLDPEESAEGAAVAAMFATWRAGGYRWSDAQASANSHGWVLVDREASAVPPTADPVAN